MATKISNNRYKSSVYLGKDTNGKRIQKVFYAETADEADFMALEFKLKKNRQEKRINLTLSEAMENYLNAKDEILAPNTLAGYKQIKKNHFLRLQSQKISDIDTAVLQAEINYELKHGNIRKKKLSPATVKKGAKFIVTVLNFYFPDKKINISFPRETKKEYATPDGKTLQRIFQAAKGSDIEIPILLASWLSLRIGEICALKWKDIKKDYIDINQSMSIIEGKKVMRSTKTEASDRKIPLPKHIKELLDKTPKESEYVTELDFYQIRYRFNKLLNDNDIPKCRFHDLRHANASIMLQLGIPDRYAQERGGWASTAVLKNTYQQTFSEESLKVAKKIDDYFEQLIHTKIHTSEK